MKIVDQLLIDAPVERVWALTEDVERWPTLTPTIRSVERLETGPFGLGSTARIVQPRQRPAVWTVTRFDRPTRFEWRTTVFGITMTGGHELEDLGESCRNTLTLDVSGRGSGLFMRLFGRVMRAAIATENRGFKQHAEAAVTPA